jgi:hypothetical protein
MPLWDARTLWIEPRSFPNARAMSFDDCPRFHRSQSSLFCEAESPRRFIRAICTIS